MFKYPPNEVLLESLKTERNYTYKTIPRILRNITNISLVFLRKCLCAHLVVLTQVSPHAGPVSSSHEHMVSKEIYSRYGAGEFPRGGVVMIPEVRDHIVELQQLVPLVLLFEPCVKGDFGYGAVGCRANGTGGHIRSRLPR